MEAAERPARRPVMLTGRTILRGFVLPLLLLSVGFVAGVKYASVHVPADGALSQPSRRYGRLLLSGGRECGDDAPLPTVGHPWQPPASPKGTTYSFRQYMASVPRQFHEPINRWRLSTYLRQVWRRRAMKYGEQLNVWDANQKAMAEGDDFRSGSLYEPELNLVWFSNASKEDLERRKAEADEQLAKITPIVAQAEKDAERAAAEGPFPLWLAATSPLPEDRPVWREYNVSFMLQYFKKPEIIREMTRRLWDCTHGDLGTGTLGPGVTSELLINVDSRGDAGEWEDVMRQYASGRFVNPVLSNDLHEVHGYNRLASLARGRVLILLQDDDMPPEECTWVKYTLLEFQRHQRLGAVGLRNGIMFHPHTVLDEVYSKGHAQSDLSWERCREVRSVKNSPYRDDVVGVPFSFVTVVDMAPLALRREAFDDCGILTDWEISMRLWNNGWQVGLISGTSWFFQQMGVGGTHSHPLTGALCWHKQPRLFVHIEERQRHDVGVRAFKAVKEANEGLELRLEKGKPLPWEECCTMEPGDKNPGIRECPSFQGNPWPPDWPQQVARG